MRFQLPLHDRLVRKARELTDPLWPGWIAGEMRRRKLAPAIAEFPDAEVEEHCVAVVMAHLNRAGRRLENCLQSLRLQDLPESCVDITIADLGSRPEVVEELRELGSRYRVRIVLLKAPDAGWNRGYLLNVAARQSDPRACVIQCADADCLYPPRFLREVLRAHLVLQPAFVSGRVAWLSEVYTPEAIDVAGDLMALARHPSSRLSAAGPWGGLLSFWRPWFDRVHGHDERFRGWGGNDQEIPSRARRAGQVAFFLGEDVPVLHQWHDPGSCGKDQQRWLANQRLLLYGFRIGRNPNGWGELTPQAEVVEPRPVLNAAAVA